MAEPCGDDRTMTFTGRVATGKGEGAGFTSAPWARAAFQNIVGIDPFPGTLNLIIEDHPGRAAWGKLRATGGHLMAAPDPAWCDGRLYPVVLAGRIKGAVVVPDVADYPGDQVEIIAAVNLRAALGVEDGDSVVVASSGS